MAFAEYNGHQIKFSIGLKNGSEIIGYNYLATIYNKDNSISYKAFLENSYDLVLRNQFNDSVGAFTYYINRIKYNFKDYNGENRFIHTLTDKKDIDIRTIKTFKIIELIDQSYAIGMSSHHKWNDRHWMKNNPVEKQSFGGTFCTHDIYIHTKTNATDKLIKKLNEISERFDTEIKEQQEVLEHANGQPYYEAEEKINVLEEAIDGEIAKVLQGFNTMKVVIITMCTC